MINGKDKEAVFEREIKGLDMVRRDWSSVAKKCSEFTLDVILSGKPKEEMIQLICEYLVEVERTLVTKF
mgnify:CR=1 FL=1